MTTIEMRRPSAEGFVRPGEPARAVPPQAELLELAELQPGDARSAGQALVSTISPLLNVKTRLQICVGETTMSLAELLALKADEVVSLDRGPDDQVDLLVDGQPVARGQLVAVGDCFGVRITEPAAPLRS